MDKQRGFDFLAGLVLGAVLVSLATHFVTSRVKNIPAIPLQSATTETAIPITQSATPSPPPTQKAKKDSLPMLPPPAFAPTLPQVLYSDAKGEVPLAWVPVENARRYEVKITDDGGHRVQLSGWVHTTVSLKGLPPPSLTESERVFWVEIATQNKDQVAGAYGAKRKIVYLGKALSTPKIESIHVEE